MPAGRIGPRPLLEKDLNYLKWAVALLVAAFPALSLVLHNAANACLYLLLICSLVAGICRFKPMGIAFPQLLKTYWPLHLAMAAWCIAVLLNQFSTGDFAGKHYDRALRLALFAPLPWIMLLLPFRFLKTVEWTAVAGVFAAAIKAYLLTSGGSERPTNIGFLSAIAYSDIALLLGTIAALSLWWDERRTMPSTILKVTAFFAGIYTTMLTGVRGSWLAIPLVLIIMFFFETKIGLRRKLLIAATCAALVGVAFSMSTVAQQRVRDAVSDVRQYQSGANPDTSIGMRLQMWHAAWLLFQEHPVFGAGRENYSPGVQRLAAQGVISPAAAHFAHSHNELLFNLAIGGIFGLLAILGIYCIPAYYFYREMRHRDPRVHTAAAMGISVCLCYFVFGLTDLMFFWTAIGAFYTMSIALFLACIIRCKEEIRAVAARPGPAQPSSRHKKTMKLS